MHPTGKTCHTLPCLLYFLPPQPPAHTPPPGRWRSRPTTRARALNAGSHPREARGSTRDAASTQTQPTPGKALLAAGTFLVGVHIT